MSEHEFGERADCNQARGTVYMDIADYAEFVEAAKDIGRAESAAALSTANARIAELEGSVAEMSAHTAKLSVMLAHVARLHYCELTERGKGPCEICDVLASRDSIEARR